MWAHELCCPVCFERLAAHQAGAAGRCLSCGRRYTCDAGIFDFSTPESILDPNGNSALAQRLTEEVRSEGWLPALRRLAVEQPEVAARIIDPIQVGWLIHCYDQQAHETCLNIGSGWGTLSYALSRFYSTVYSLESCREQLRFQAARARAEDVGNVVLLRSSVLALPLTGSALDMVIVTRLPPRRCFSEESFGESYPLDNFLHELRRVLKPGGILCFCVEPRLHRSLQQLVQGLQRAGFGALDSYWVWPDLDMPRMMGTSDGRSIRHLASWFGNLMDNGLARWLIRAGCQLPDRFAGRLQQLLVRSDLIVASQHPSGTTPQQSALQAAPGARSFVQLAMAARPDHRVQTTLLLLDQDGVAKSVRVQEIQPGPRQTSTFVYHQAQGVKGRLLRPSCRRDVRAAASWLADWHGQNGSGVWQSGEITAEMEALCLAVRQLPAWDTSETMLSAFVRRYVQALEMVQLPLVTEHGDFTPPNIVITRQGELHVMDWEYSRERGNPLVDIGAFSLSLLRRSSVNGVFRTGPARGPLMTFWREYARRFPIPLDLAPAYYVLRWLARIATVPAEDETQALIAAMTVLPLLPPALQFSLSTEQPPQPWNTAQEGKLPWVQRSTEWPQSY